MGRKSMWEKDVLGRATEAADEEERKTADRSGL
jgi:hypothetical protein